MKRVSEKWAYVLGLFQAAAVSTYERTVPHDAAGHISRAALKRHRKSQRNGYFGLS